MASTRTRISLNNQGPSNCSQSLRMRKVIIKPYGLSFCAKLRILKGIAFLPLPENNKIIDRRNQKKKISFKLQLYQKLLKAEGFRGLGVEMFAKINLN